jgi:hypothetical protein
MKTLALNQMKVIEGGNESKNTATGFMCGAAVCFLFMDHLHLLQEHALLVVRWGYFLKNNSLKFKSSKNEKIANRRNGF